MSTCRNHNEILITHPAQNKFKLIEDFHIRFGTLKLTEEKVGSMLEHINMVKNILNRTIGTQEVR